MIVEIASIEDLSS